ncbi:MAG: hypothetical protein HYZ57_01405 [Acidobacteria bacterium]|nr:hypothetical protein [Acidobacteriota bacterium]
MPPRTFLAALLSVASILGVPAAAQNQLDGNLTVFSVMTALTAAGPDHGLNPGDRDSFRAAVRKRLAARNIEVLPELKSFLSRNSRNLAPYVSFALSTEAPAFQFRYRENEMPPDAAALIGFQELMARFYAQAGIDDLWREAQPAFDQIIERYHEPVSRALLEANAYLRNPTSGAPGRQFRIYVDLLGPPNQTHTRSYGADYFVVITPAAEPQPAEVRHAYLHYLLDPAATHHADEVNKRKSLLDIAEGAPLLAASYKEDFLLLTTESLIKAIEARLAAPAARQGLVERALAEGYVLTPYFAEALPGYEKQEQAMRLYFPELISGIDLSKEAKRLEKVQFASARRQPAAPAAARQPDLTPAQKVLEDAETTYAARDLERASELYRRLLGQTGERGMHARAYYGLARIAALRNDPGLAEKLFQKTLELAPDPQTAAWAHVYLGRLALAARESEQAAQRFQAALNTPGASEAARNAAADGLKKTLAK